MNTSGNTVLVTGGSSGIGLALAERFLAAGNEVVVCGRRERLLNDLRAKHPKMHTLVADTGIAAERESLVAKAIEQFPALNVIINNAGIQRRIAFATGQSAASGAQEMKVAPWSETASEIAINFEGPIHLSMLLIPHLLKQKNPVIANVSSGLAFVPMAHMPVYCATKAALHSFTLSLRQQLTSTPIHVVEIIPPAVRTNLGGAHDFGVALDEYADSVMAQLAEGRAETTYEMSVKVSQASRAELDDAFTRMNNR